MASLSDFNDFIQSETDKYLQSTTQKHGEVKTQRQEGQRKRRLREALYKASAAVPTNSMSFTTDNTSFIHAAINALVEKANIRNSVGQDIEKYGVPPGAEIVDEGRYEEIVGYTLYPKDGIFGTRDGFDDWLVNVYISERPMLEKMIDYYYWYKKDKSIVFGNPRTPDAKVRALKWLSYTLRKKISQNGIRPRSVIFTGTDTILNYDKGIHILRG